MDKKSVTSHLTVNLRKGARWWSRTFDIFSRGLIVSNPKEWYFLTGQTDVDQEGNVRHPGDPMGQTRGILESLKDMLDREGWSLHDVVRLQMDQTDLSHEHVEGILAVQEDFWKDVDPKPVWGTVRTVTRFAIPGCVVEIELLAAR